MDRMDCQLITGLFTAVYYGTFLSVGMYASVPRILKMFDQLSADEQQMTFKMIREKLEML